jgi:aryl-alcohol dehydrogenase-like predicted oxidoreductase
MYRHDEPYLAEVCVHEAVSYLPYSPLVAGSISGKYLGGARPEGARWSLGKDKRKNQRETAAAEAAVRDYIAVADKYGLDVCQMALAFCYQQPFITSTIIGATSMEQLKTDIAAKDITLSDECLNDIQKVHNKYPVPY